MTQSLKIVKCQFVDYTSLLKKSKRKIYEPQGFYRNYGMLSETRLWYLKEGVNFGSSFGKKLFLNKIIQNIRLAQTLMHFLRNWEKLPRNPNSETILNTFSIEMNIEEENKKKLNKGKKIVSQDVEVLLKRRLLCNKFVYREISF